MNHNRERKDFRDNKKTKKKKKLKIFVSLI